MSRWTTNTRGREGKLFTDESRLPGACMGHRHLIEPTESGSRLTNTIYIKGPARHSAAGSWSPRHTGTLPDAQRAVAELAQSVRACPG